MFELPPAASLFLTGHHCRRLVVDADLEAGGTPVDELDRALRLDGGDGGVDVLGHDVTAVQHAARHVLAVSWVALHHLVGRLETRRRDVGHRQLLVVRLLRCGPRRVHQSCISTRIYQFWKLTAQAPIRMLLFS